MEDESKLSKIETGNQMNLLSLTIFYNGLEHHINLLKNSTLSDLMNVLTYKLNICLPMYDIYFNNFILKRPRTTLLSQIIKNYPPVFSLKKKSSFSNYYTLNLDGSQGIDLIIENFPSYNEIYEQIVYYANSQYKKPKITITNDYPLRVSFLSREEAQNCFVFLTDLKYSNEDYKNLKITVKFPQVLPSFNELNALNNPLSYSQKVKKVSDFNFKQYTSRAEQLNKRKNFFYLVHKNLEGINNPNLEQENEEEYFFKKNTPFPKKNPFESNKKYKLLRNESCKDYRGSFGAEIRNLNENNSPRNKKEILHFIRNDSPYLSPYDKNILEHFKNKEKWITNKGFICNVNHRKCVEGREIKNYVREDPSESPLSYNFREVNKHKWIDIQGWK